MEFVRKNAPGILICLVIAVPAWLLGQRFEVVGGPVFAILIGMVIALFWKDQKSAKSGITYTSKKILQLAVVLLGGALAVVMTFFPYASNRIASWLDPFSNTQGVGYQIIQSLYAIGSGGLFGLGLGHGRQKYLYLPEEHNDFIFSVVCEELGFIGAALILCLFAMLILRGYWIALHQRHRYDFLVCAGISTLLAIQVFLNVAVVTNLVPCTGISLPLFSYGGTALLIQLFEMGIILSASRDVSLK